MRRFSILARMLVPVLIVFGFIIGGIGVYISSTYKQNLVDASIQNGQNLIQQFKILRSYYTKNVVSKVKQQQALRISFDHHDRSDTIPLPATLIHDLSALFEKQALGINLKLYSEFPFPNRKDRVLDEFGKEGLAFFKTNPNATFSRMEMIDGREVVRVAIADKMVAPACVNCHNSRPDSPKTDWKLNDIRGVLEIDIPVAAQLSGGRQNIFEIIFILTGGGILLVAVIAYLTIHLRTSLQKIETEISEVTSSTNDLTLRSEDEKAVVVEIGASLQEMISTIQSIAEFAAEICSTMSAVLLTCSTMANSISPA